MVMQKKHITIYKLSETFDYTRKLKKQKVPGVIISIHLGPIWQNIFEQIMVISWLWQILLLAKISYDNFLIVNEIVESIRE